MQFFGTEGRIDIEIPFKRPHGQACAHLYRQRQGTLRDGSAITESFPVCNQYTIQGDLFSQAIRENKEVPNPLEDAICNMAVIDALFRSAESGHWKFPSLSNLYPMPLRASGSRRGEPVYPELRRAAPHLGKA